MESALEQKLLNSYKNEMISFMNNHPEYFEEAMVLAISDNQPYSWRAAYVLWSVIDENDKRVQKYIKKIVQAVKNKSDGHQRELLKILLMMDLDEKYEGVLFDLCSDIWEQIEKAPSVRINALKMIINIAKKHPELYKEISFLMQDHYMESLSPGARHSAKRIMNELNKKVIDCDRT